MSRTNPCCLSSGKKAKAYLNDPGLTNHSITSLREVGRLMENAIFLELRRRGEAELFCWKDHREGGELRVGGIYQKADPEFLSISHVKGLK